MHKLLSVLQNETQSSLGSWETNESFNPSHKTRSIGNKKKKKNEKKNKDE